MKRDIIKDWMRKADMLEAAFVVQFEHGVNKTAFLFFDYVASQRYRKNSKLRDAYCVSLDRSFTEYAKETRTKKTWRGAIAWYVVWGDRAYRDFKAKVVHSLGQDN